MTVAELIDRLKAFPPGAPVVFCKDRSLFGGEWAEFDAVHRRTAKKTENDDYTERFTVGQRKRLKTTTTPNGRAVMWSLFFETKSSNEGRSCHPKRLGIDPD